MQVLKHWGNNDDDNDNDNDNTITNTITIIDPGNHKSIYTTFKITLGHVLPDSTYQPYCRNSFFASIVNVLS